MSGEEKGNGLGRPLPELPEGTTQVEIVVGETLTPGLLVPLGEDEIVEVIETENENVLVWNPKTGQFESEKGRIVLRKNTFTIYPGESDSKTKE